MSTNWLWSYTTKVVVQLTNWRRSINKTGIENYVFHYLVTVARHNIIQIHNNAIWDWQFFTRYSRKFSHSNWMWRIFCGVLSIPRNIVMDLNDVMEVHVCGFIDWIGKWVIPVVFTIWMWSRALHFPFKLHPWPTISQPCPPMNINIAPMPTQTHGHGCGGLNKSWRCNLISSEHGSLWCFFFT